MTVPYLIVDRSNGFFLPGIYEPPRMSKWTFEHWNEAHDRIFRNNAKDSVPIVFNSKKIIFVRRAQRTEFNISSKKLSRQIPYCIRSIHVIQFNVLIVYHPWLSNGLIIDIHLELGWVKYWAYWNIHWKFSKHSGAKNSSSLRRSQRGHCIRLCEKLKIFL